MTPSSTKSSKSKTSRLETEDRIVDSVIQRLVDRSAQGMVTYGVSMADNPLSKVEWIDHAIEEALDFACYLERLKDEIKKEEG